MSCKLCPGGPDTHKTGYSTKLLDLPDDTLAKILKYLLGPVQALSSRSSSEARNSFALATCNTRLLSLFRPVLRQIDSSPVPEDAPRSFKHVWPSKFENIAHLAALARLAGPELRVLRLPNIWMGKCSGLLYVVSQHCTKLQELSYFDDSSRSGFVETLLFARSKGLRRVEIVRPKTVFKALSYGPLLHEVRFLDVGNKWYAALKQFLWEKGRKIRLLQVSLIREKEGVDVQPGRASIDDFRDLVEYIRQSLRTRLPSLESLEIAPCSLDQIEDRINWSTPEAFSQLISNVKSIVANARMRDTGSLARIRLCTEEHVMLPCLEALAPLVSTDTVVEVEFREATLRFARSRTGENQGSVICFRLSERTKPYAAANLREFGKLRSLTIEVNHAMEGNVQNDANRAIVESLSREAGTDLCEIRILCGFTGSLFWSREAHRVVASTLQAVDHVKYVELSRIILERVDLEQLSEMLSWMRHVDVIRLNAPRRMNAIGSEMRVGEHLKFVRRIPPVLKRLAEHCRQLKCLYLTMSGISFGLHTALFAQSVAEALNAVKEFEQQLPDVDVRSITAQLEKWVEPLSPSFSPGNE